MLKRRRVSTELIYLIIYDFYINQTLLETHDIFS